MRPGLHDEHLRPEISKTQVSELLKLSAFLGLSFWPLPGERFGSLMGSTFSNGSFDGLQSLVQGTRGRYSFRFVRGNPRTGAGSYSYGTNDFDVTACVALSMERAIFVPGVHTSIRLTTADFRRDDGERQSWARALQVFKQRASQA